MFTLEKALTLTNLNISLIELGSSVSSGSLLDRIRAKSAVFIIITIVVEQAGAELCQAKHSLS